MFKTWFTLTVIGAGVNERIRELTQFECTFNTDKIVAFREISWRDIENGKEYIATAIHLTPEMQSYIVVKEPYRDVAEILSR